MSEVELIFRPVSHLHPNQQVSCEVRTKNILDFVLIRCDEIRVWHQAFINGNNVLADVQLPFITHDWVHHCDLCVSETVSYMQSFKH